MRTLCRVKRAGHKGLQGQKVSGGGGVSDTECGPEVTWGWVKGEDGLRGGSILETDNSEHRTTWWVH